MGLEEVKKEILDNARKEAKLIHSEADKEIKEIDALTQKRIEEVKASYDEEARLAIEQYKTMIVAETASLINKERLAMEKEIIDEVFNLALENLSSSKNREKHLKKMVTLTKQGYSKIYCSEKDMKLVKGAVKHPISGGIVLEDSLGEQRLDLSYDTILKEMRQESLAEVAKILF